MKTRIVSALILVPLAIVVLVGGMPLVVAAFVIGLMAIWEFADGFAKINIKLCKPLALTSLILLYTLHASRLLSDMTSEVFFQWVMLWFFFSVASSLITVIFTKEHDPIAGIMTVASVFYIGFFSSHIVLFELLPQGTFFIWLTLLTAFGTDIFAYFAGMFFGRNKLCLALSPKKTIEGAIGGVVGSVALSVGYCLIFSPSFLLHCIVIGFFGSIFAQFGDLVASAFKRKMGVKDYGSIIPGHGGILDRFDSILFTTPFVYYYVLFMI